MAEYSALSLLRNALAGNRDWKPAWRKAEPEARLRRRSSSAAAGMGCRPPTTSPRSTASAMSRCSRRAGWAPAMSAATPRSCAPTTCCRTSIRFYEHSMRLWENLSHDLNFNVMFSQRGILNLAHTPAQADDYIRRGNAMRHGGGDAVWLTPAEIGRKVRGLDVSGSARFPVVGGLLQPQGRHGPPRRGRLGLCARRRPARRRHPGELRGDRLPARRRPDRSA